MSKAGDAVDRTGADKWGFGRFAYGYEKALGRAAATLFEDWE
jgi:hypothetical protein